MPTDSAPPTPRRRLRRTAVNLTLLAASIFISVFALDAMVLAIFELNTSYRRAPNAEYDFESDPFTFHVKLNDALSSLTPRQDVRQVRLLRNVLDLKPRNLLRFIDVQAFNRVPTPPHAMPGTKTANPLTKHLESDDSVVRERLAAINPEMLDRALRWRVNPFMTAGSIREPDLLAQVIAQNNALVRNPSVRLEGPPVGCGMPTCTRWEHGRRHRRGRIHRVGIQRALSRLPCQGIALKRRTQVTPSTCASGTAVLYSVPLGGCADDGLLSETLSSGPGDLRMGRPTSRTRREDRSCPQAIAQGTQTCP